MIRRRKPMTMTQKKDAERVQRARAAQMGSESKARRGREPSKTAVGGAENKEQIRQNRMRREREANMAMVKKDRPMPKRPSAISLANAADPKAKRPTKPQTPPTTSSVATPGRTPTRTTNNQSPPASGLANVTGKDRKPGLRRNVGAGREEKANVTREQLQKTGLSLRDYLNFMDKNDRRPTSKADSTAAKALTAAFKAKKAKKSGVAKVPNRDPRKKYAGGGMMKSKMKAKGMKAGGKMKTKGYMAGGMMKAKGMKAGGKMPMVKDPKTGKMVPEFAADGKGKMMAGGKVKSKGYAKGGMMKSKGYAKGGAMKSKMAAKKPTKQKVRGAGIARKGVRPAKMR